MRGRWLLMVERSFTPRGAVFVALAACVLTWFIVAPHLSPVGLWPAIVIVSVAVMPATLFLVLLALPLWSRRALLVPATITLALLALVFSLLDWGLAANFAKLWAAVFAGWAFLMLFEQLSWVVLVALVIPAVDAISVWRGPTKAITAHHFEVYTAVAIAFLVPGGGAAYLGPPDVLFYALFLAAAARWNLRVFWTWFAMTFMYSFTVVFANALDVGGLPALPFLSFGFLVANADLLWARRRSAGSSGSPASPSSSGDDPAPS
jgi:hypothetical protein